MDAGHTYHSDSDLVSDHAHLAEVSVLPLHHVSLFILTLDTHLTDIIACLIVVIILYITLTYLGNVAKDMGCN